MKGKIDQSMGQLLVLELDGALSDLADLVAQRAGENVEAMGISDIGTLRSSIEADVETFLRKLVIVGTPYAAYVEFGTGPAAGRGRYMPPLAPILAWVKRNLRIESSSGEVLVKPKRKAGTRALRDREALRVAQAVRWKIYHHGINPRPFLRMAFNRSLQDAQEVFDLRMAGFHRRIGDPGR